MCIRVSCDNDYYNVGNFFESFRNVRRESVARYTPHSLPSSGIQPVHKQYAQCAHNLLTL